MSLSFSKFLGFFLGLTLFTSPVFAYIDPGTGSILFQALVGGLAAIISFFSIYWQRVKAFFSKKKSNQDDD